MVDALLFGYHSDNHHFSSFCWHKKKDIIQNDAEAWFPSLNLPKTHLEDEQTVVFIDSFHEMFAAATFSVSPFFLFLLCLDCSIESATLPLYC